MTDYTDSEFWAGSSVDSPGIWVRDPVIDGVTKLNEAMRLLDQARKEVQAIENVLGTDVAGSETDLTTRLNRRLSPCGLQRAWIHQLRGVNPTVGTYNNGENWYQGGTVYVQMGVYNISLVQAKHTITYQKAYFTALPPEVIVCCMQTSNQRVAVCQLDVTSLSSLTAFQVGVRGYSSSGSWGFADTLAHRIIWIAFGGFPSS